MSDKVPDFITRNRCIDGQVLACIIMEIASLFAAFGLHSAAHLLDICDKMVDYGLTQEVYEINWYDVCYQFELERYRAFVRREPLCKD